MVRVSSEKPKLAFEKASNDMGHFYPSRWTVRGTREFVLTDEMYLKLMQFTNPDLKTNGNDVGLLENGTIGSRSAAALALNPSKTLIWEFNALEVGFPRKAEYVRSFAVFGERNFYIPTRLDIIKRHFLKVIAGILNFLRTLKVRREQKQWDAWKARAADRCVVKYGKEDK